MAGARAVETSPLIFVLCMTSYVHREAVKPVFSACTNDGGCPLGCRIHSRDFYLECCMYFKLFLFAKKMKFLAKGGIPCISRSSLGTYSLYSGTHWPN